MDKQYVKVGDTVMWSGSFGSAPEQPAKITQIDHCSGPHSKYGVPVEQVEVGELRNCCVSLDNGHWAYGTQLRPIPQGATA